MFEVQSGCPLSGEAIISNDEAALQRVLCEKVGSKTKTRSMFFVMLVLTKGVDLECFILIGPLCGFFRCVDKCGLKCNNDTIYGTHDKSNKALRYQL